MKAIVVYESHWGNTAAIAKAIAEGIGSGTPALNTSEATAEAIAGADLLVVGAPVLGFSLANEQMRKGLTREKIPPQPGTLDRPGVRAWLEQLPPASGSSGSTAGGAPGRTGQAGPRARSAAFETRISWSPGGSVGAITRALAKAGYPALSEPGKFIVAGRYGPLREGELDRARAWGKELAENAGLA